MVVLYTTSLVVIIATGVWMGLDSRIPSGIIGTACIGGVAVFSLAACDTDPPNWLVGQTASLAGLCLWGATRILWKRRHLRKRVRSL